MDKGTYTYPDGAKYEGDWQNNKRHGRGLWTRPDGMKYEGEWENDKPNGQGTLTLPNGNKRSGLWKEGKFISEQQPVEPKEDDVQELVISQKARIQDLEEANKKLKLEVSALTDKVANLEGQKGQSDFFKEDDFATPLRRTEEKPPPEKLVRGEKQVRKKSKVWWVVAAVLLLLVIIIIANSGGDEEPVSAPEEQVEEAPETAIEEPVDEAEETLKIGDTITMGNMEFTVNAARFDAGSEFMQPNEGEKWLVVDCTIANNGDESEVISSMLMFSLYDEDHRSRNLEIGANTEGQLDGELGAGRTMRGEIAYSVPADHSTFEFIFAPNVLGFGQSIFLIEMD